MARRPSAEKTYDPVTIARPPSNAGLNERISRWAFQSQIWAVPSKQLSASVHGVDERLPIADLGKAVRVIYAALKTL